MENLNTMQKLKGNVFNVGWVTYIIILALLGVALFTHQFGLMIGISLVGYIGAVIGNVVRLYTMPIMYLADGTVWTSFKEKTFWNHGPQVIGFFSIFIVLFILGSFIK